MNDFTKEELKFILIILDEWYEAHNSKETKEDSILYRSCCVADQIQSMIDNYCEHKQHKYYGYLPAGECAECGMVVLA